MATATNSILLTLMVFFVVADLAAATTKDICEGDSNPEACKKTLETLQKERRADPIKTIRNILNFGLLRGQNLKGNMTKWARAEKLRANEHAALKSCLDAVDEGVDDLRKTLKEVDELEKAQNAHDTQDIMFHTSNLKTWLNSAINTIGSCQDTFSMPGLDGQVKRDVLSKLPDMIIATRIALWTIELPTQRSQNTIT